MKTIASLLRDLDVIEFIGNRDQSIKQIVPLPENESKPTDLFWANDKNISKLNSIQAGTVICSQLVKEQDFSKTLNVIIVKNPRDTFRRVLQVFSERQITAVISGSASISPTATIGKNVSIGHHTVIGDDCEIGNNCVIGHNTVVSDRTVIGNNVKVGHNNTIGGTGFGYEKDDKGEFQLIPHVGNVILEDNVEVGNNTCIDRAVLGSTILRYGCKVDNLVHIAHGVIVGKNSVVIANAMVAGSVIIGENVWVAPSASILNKIEIKSNAVIGLGAVVRKTVNEGETIVGNPGKPLHRKINPE